MKKSFCFLTLLLFSTFANSQIIYSTPEKPWLESFGNHRALLQLDEAAPAVLLNLEWRRHDQNPEEKLFIIIEEATGDTIPIIRRIKVDQEVCELLFGPVERPGKYHFYYLPYKVQTGYGFYYGDYITENRAPSTEYQNDYSSSKASTDVVASIVEIQSRTSFDSFFPMEVTALKSELKELLELNPDPFLVFPEDREFPVRMKDAIPKRWVDYGTANDFYGVAKKNEYYAFQLGVYASATEIENLQITFSEVNPLVIPAQAGSSSSATIPITCFNASGIDPYGTPFTKQISIAKGNVQALWFGLDIPEEIQAGEYKGKITLSPSQSSTFSKTIDFTLSIVDEVLLDRGDSEPWRHSRLRWLNSSAGIDTKPVAPYGPVESISETKSKTKMATIQWHESGFPSQIKVKKDILSKPIEIQMQSGDTEISFSYPGGKMIQHESGEHKWEHSWENEKLEVLLSSSLEFDGYQRYTISLDIKEGIKLDDFSLNIPFLSEIASYMMGMGLPGCSTPESHTGKWLKPQDSFWMGNSEGGLWCEIRGSSYHGPLQNLYKPGHPSPWYNDDKGYMSVHKNGKTTLATVGTGPIEMNPGEKWVFEFALLPTPVKNLNPKDQFTNRYYHNGGSPDSFTKELQTGIKILNVHHASKYNPYINYPFIAVDTLQGLIDQAHEMGLKLKIYYTIRELTNHVTEIWALRSLGDEILREGSGGGYPWLREHFIDNYHPQWYQHLEDGSPDASCLTSTTASRWYNYYIEGLKWLIKNQDIDGLYLDDVSFDRRILKRMRKVMEEIKPGCLIDLHSNTGFSIGPAIQYTGYFPYVNKLWFGESFKYNEMSPENWFVEVSGIPFGLMGDMLHGGGNRWLGMLFGMTVRLPWTSEGNTADPRPIWKFWDEFGIAEAEMFGFWGEQPVGLDYADEKDYTDEGDSADDLVRVTVYRKSDEILIAVGNFGDTMRKVTLDIDWDELELDPDKCELIAPAIKGFQPSKTFDLKDEIIVPSKEGWLLICRPKFDIKKFLY